MKVEEADAIIARAFPDDHAHADHLYVCTVMDFLMGHPIQEVFKPEARIALARELVTATKPSILFADQMAVPRPAGDVVPFRPRPSLPSPTGGDAA